MCQMLKNYGLPYKCDNVLLEPMYSNVFSFPYIYIKKRLNVAQRRHTLDTDVLRFFIHWYKKQQGHWAGFFSVGKCQTRC